MESTTKRKVFGDLQNRGLASTKATLKKSKALKPAQPLKTVKARVDKQPLTTTDKEPAAKRIKDQISVKKIKRDKAKARSKKSRTKLPAVIAQADPEVSSPEAIRDIDANDKGNLVLVPEYVNDIYDHLNQLEEQKPICKDHLAGQMAVSPRMRAILVDWINEVHLQFHLAPETFQLTVSIMDRFLQVVKNTERGNFQLVGITALFLAAKYEELFPPPIADLVYITDYTYDARQIRQMELLILKAIDYNVSYPLPINFLRRYSKAADAEVEHHTMSKYFIELATMNYDLASYKPSEIAAASLFLSLHLLRGDKKVLEGFEDRIWTPTLTFYSRYSAVHLRPIATQIAKLARKAPKAKLQGVFIKYKDAMFMKIALREELSGSLIDTIIGRGPKK